MLPDVTTGTGRMTLAIQVKSNKEKPCFAGLFLWTSLEAI